MDYRTAIFYLALLIVVGVAAELYVRMKGLGENTEKVRGVVTAKKPRIGPPIALLIVAIIVAAMNIPH
ncbi:MAG: hypothetical protein Q8K85_04475 [Hyphomicrobium sp.]|nr:hypothetical protein [Hyphomicrobium sp.]